MCVGFPSFPSLPPGPQGSSSPRCSNLLVARKNFLHDRRAMQRRSGIAWQGRYQNISNRQQPIAGTVLQEHTCKGLEWSINPPPANSWHLVYTCPRCHTVTVQLLSRALLPRRLPPSAGGGNHVGTSRQRRAGRPWFHVCRIHDGRIQLIGTYIIRVHVVMDVVFLSPRQRPHALVFRPALSGWLGPICPRQFRLFGPGRSMQHILPRPDFWRSRLDQVDASGPGN